ncbi:MAG: Hpt domain-containing protein [Candidatus Spyradocola sp.]
MTIQECYQQLGGDYEQAAKRLPSVSLVTRFIGKFLDDGSYAELRRAMAAGDRAEAFRAAHTLKGVCGNLSFDRLLASTERLTALLRPEGETIPAGADALLAQVEQDYALTIGAIRAYLSQSTGK